MADSHFRDHLPDLSTPRFTSMKTQDAHQYVASFKNTGNPPWLHSLYLFWRKLLQEPFKGVTSDGIIRPGLYKCQDEGVAIDGIVGSANDLIGNLDVNQRDRLQYHIDSPEWRTWSNPEFLLSNKGLRLDEVTPSIRDLILNILRCTLSPEGYEKAVSAMRINHFLGELVESPAVMNEYSYNFVLFGQPSTSSPWGMSFYGHHLCLNIFFYRRQIIIAPWFTGAEPNYIDAGPYKGTRILHEEERLGLELMQSLSPELQVRAQTYQLMKDPAMPHGRWNHDDQRHLCGAYRDNRIVPYEGIIVSQCLSHAQQDLVIQILQQYLLYLPSRSRIAMLDLCRSHFNETYFSWIGGFHDTDPYYFRLQSPIIIVEFDHHSGVFLTNKEPAKFHIHTLMRMPNGGDYGMALRTAIPASEYHKQEFVWEG